jgi:hypothetical protein
MSKLSDYPFEIRPLTEEEGGGFLISFPDFAASPTVRRLKKRWRVAAKH